MLDVLNLTSSDDTFDRRVSTITSSSSPTVAMDQYAGRDEPIGGVRYLTLVDCEDDLPKSNTCLAVQPSLLRRCSRTESLVHSQNFRKNMSTVIKLNNMDAYVLQNMMPKRDATTDKPPLLGRSIVLDVKERRLIHEGSGAKDHSNVSYDKVLMFWKLLLFQELRHNIDELCSAVEPSSSNPKRVSPHYEARDAHRSTGGHASQHEEGESKITSNDKSKINFKHQRGRRSKKLRAADLEGDETNFKYAFDNIPIPSDIPIDLTKVGDIDFKMGASFNIDAAMIEEAIEPLNVLTNKTITMKGKDIHIERNLVERSNPTSPTQTHHSVNGPSTFEISAKTLGIPLDAKGILRAPSHGDVFPAPSISTIRVTLSSRGIFTSAIKILGNEYLTLLKQTPFEKCKVDEYVWAVKGHLALKTSLSNHRRSDQVRKERLAIVEELKLAESSYDAALTKHQELEEESVALKKKEDEILKELKDVRQRMNQVTNDLGDNGNPLTTLEATVHATKRRVEEFEAVPLQR
ncbi:Dehydrogenase patE [Bienertia sinuspersici]